jgi:acyl-CoA reductase-like NAD-dependent aldehyde dehydrogenase
MTAAADVQTDNKASYHAIINGQPVNITQTRAVHNPADGSLVGYAPLGTAAHLDDAVAAARRAQPLWAALDDSERANACGNLAKALTDNAAELAELLTKEQGKPLKGMGSEFELGGCAGWMGFAAQQQLPVKVLQDDDAARVEQHHVPIGVIGSITPWNWPLMIAIWHIAPALRTGNCVVIKPSPYTTLSTLRMVEILASHLPAGVLNIVPDGGDIGPAMAQHSGIDKITFTGSTATGQKIMAAAAPTLKKLTLEMGGNDAGIVLADADPQTIAEGLFWGAFINNGQTCAALKRLYVHDSIYDDVCAALSAVAGAVPMGNGLDENNVLGPLQNAMQFDKVSSLVEQAKADGARILTGGQPLQPDSDGENYLYPITLIADAKEGMACVDEEQFGPMLPIIRYSDVDDAVRQANSLDIDLAASVWSQDMDAANAVARRLDAGTVYINKHGEVAPHIPFGGSRWSSIGVEFSEEGLAACTNIKIYNMAK